MFFFFLFFFIAPPYPSAYTHPPIAVQADKPVVLNCQVTAMPKPTYSWFIYNSQNYQTYPIDSADVILNGSTLTIMSIYRNTVAYSMWYMCLASNTYGESRHYFRLDVSLSSLVTPSPLATPTKDELMSVQGSGVVGGAAAVMPVVAAMVAASLLALVLCSTGLALYLSRRCRK